jgi:hypothetical protein
VTVTEKEKEIGNARHVLWLVSSSAVEISINMVDRILIHMSTCADRTDEDKLPPESRLDSDPDPDPDPEHLVISSSDRRTAHLPLPAGHPQSA